MSVSDRERAGAFYDCDSDSDSDSDENSTDSTDDSGN
jgi:hypothetical protein